MLVALTGATGFLGYHTVRTLHAAGHRVRVLARRTSRRDHIEPYVAEWVFGDFYDPQAQAGLVAGAECVIHAAVDYHASDHIPVQNFDRNVAGTLKLLEAARLAGAEQFIFVSSGAAYAEILPDRKLDEKHPTWPDSLYGAYKASVEPFLKGYHARFGINTSSWRPVAIYGVHHDIGKSRWIDQVRAVKAGENVDQKGGGKIVHVQDVADALTCAVGDQQVAGKYFNLVDRHMYWQQVAEIAREITGSSSRIADNKGPGPKNTYDTTATQEFFDRHGKTRAIRRGLDGIREYVTELLPLV